MFKALLPHEGRFVREREVDRVCVFKGVVWDHPVLDFHELDRRVTLLHTRQPPLPPGAFTTESIRSFIRMVRQNPHPRVVEPAAAPEGGEGRSPVSSECGKEGGWAP